MKKLALPIIILFIFTISPLVKPALAADLGARLTQEAGKIENFASRSAAQQSTELQKIQQRADTMITTRITSLNQLLSRIQSDSRLSDTEKSTITGNITTMINNLTALKAKIDADTDVTTARTDTKTIVTSYHVYVTFEPQIRLLTIIDNLQIVTTTISTIVPQLQSLSSTLKSQGKDTTGIDSAITDMKTQLTAINTLLSQDSSTLSSVSLANNTYQSTYTQVRQDLAKVRADFAQIQHDIATIRESVHNLIGESTLNKNNASTSASPTTSCLPRPACLSAHPACAIAEPSTGWCPSPTPTP